MSKRGVDVRLIGKVSKAGEALAHEKYPGKRLHARVIIRDHHDAFLGSQSLRKLELDKRREVGIIVQDQSIVSELARTFEDDWALTDSGRRAEKRKGEREGRGQQPFNSPRDRPRRSNDPAIGVLGVAMSLQRRRPCEGQCVHGDRGIAGHLAACARAGAQ